LPISL